MKPLFEEAFWHVLNFHIGINPKRGKCLVLPLAWTGTMGREPGRIGAGGVREAGGERAGSGIPKVAGTGRK